MHRFNYYKDIIKNYKIYGGEAMVFWDTLANLYPETLKLSFENKPEYDGYALTYGEMRSSSIKMIIEKYELYSYKVFIDIGAGTCNLPIYVAGFNHIKKSIGIEIVEERLTHGKNLLELINSELDDEICKPITSKIELIHSDIFKVNIKEMTEEMTLVWISNLCFNNETTEKLLNKLYAELPNKSIISCSKIPDSIDESKFEKISSELVEMSWNSQSEIHLYKIKKNNPNNYIIYGI